MTAVADVLIEARNLIADPADWIQGNFAIDTDGYMTHPTDPTAVAWCAVGALMRTTALSPWGSGVLYAAAFNLLTKTGDVMATNDNRGHTAVIDLYDRAIRLAKDTDQ